MSVREEERSESEVQFLMTARELLICTIRKCRNDKVMPKRYNSDGNEMIRMAMRIYANAIGGNSIKIKYQRDVVTRRKCFQKALAGTAALNSWVEAFNEVLHFPMKDMKEWSGALAYEKKLLTGVINSDDKRYQGLPK